MTLEQDKFCDNNCVWTDHHPDCKLSQQEPEWYHIIDVYGCNRFYHKTEDCPYEFKTPLYTTPPQPKEPEPNVDCNAHPEFLRGYAAAAEYFPPQRTWVGLTDEEIDVAWRSVDYTVPYEQFRLDVAKAIEAKLREKNT